ncbi:ankyrin repeat domain-containing protein [Acutalibacter muris]|uniref:ankyrin repeat domain-containing protein n=1 Tax=Acutalibacter muris TaxID=1796620 RepID=UPI00272EBFEB|nr:ankyrin repeat domain-containing protein [Acutalibacter muris]
MDIIELEHWVPDPERPHMLKYAGQSTAQEVFEELRYRLESMGYLPDEYFLMDTEWEKGRKIPKGADIFCTTDYGASEGIYIDVYLKWHEDGKPVTKSFITGKTLGESGSDLDRMFLISSAITKAFRGGDFRKNSVLSLNEQEQAIVVNALAEQRERQESALNQTEQLLRRMTGSITAYMNVVGERPLRMSDGDRAVIAIRDGDMREFKELLPHINEQEVQDQLFLEAASRPGAVGRKMTMLLLDSGSTFSPDVYKEACERAVRTVDPEKMALLQEQARSHVNDLPLDFFGELARYALQWHGVWFIAEQIMERCSPEEILAVPSELLEVAMVCGDMGIPKALAVKGVNGDHALRPFIKCREQGEPWKIKALLDMGMKVSSDNYDALAACVEYNCTEIGKALIDHGVDFEGFSGWAEGQEKDISCDTYQELAGYWREQRQ